MLTVQNIREMSFKPNHFETKKVIKHIGHKNSSNLKAARPNS